ncbi:MAG TPA: N-acetylmuramoyl-L-alanine amidase [Anaeromyxobacteraceae bacterium]|nr:N-acetylmuramoyl-L-alanine amidase [Anaeromyxobacteraceae bacterium]
MLLTLATALLALAAPAPGTATSGTAPGTATSGTALRTGRTAARSTAQQPAFVVVLDPGHGGEKDGAITVDGKREKDLVLEIARLLRKRLERQGARVVLTRSGDESVELARRAAMANAEKADLFISIHLNSAPGTSGTRARGVETYFLSADATDASATAVAARENADRLAGEPELDPADVVGGILADLEDQANLSESSRLAQAIHGALVKGTRAPDRGVKQAPFYVLAGARMPAVLVELGFVSHPVEGRDLARSSRQDAIAGAIAAGVAAWRKGASEGSATPTASTP